MGAVDYTIRPESEEDDDNIDLSPVIIAETPMAIGELSVGDAAMQMDLADKPFLIFKNASHGRINVVYRRDDGNIGWVDPKRAVPGSIGFQGQASLWERPWI